MIEILLALLIILSAWLLVVLAGRAIGMEDLFLDFLSVAQLIVAAAVLAAATSALMEIRS